MKLSRSTDALGGTAASYFADHIYDAVSVKFMVQAFSKTEVMKQSKDTYAMADIALYFADKIYQTVP
jgi:hypothetical protein